MVGARRLAKALQGQQTISTQPSRPFPNTNYARRLAKALQGQQTISTQPFRPFPNTMVGARRLAKALQGQQTISTQPSRPFPNTNYARPLAKALHRSNTSNENESKA
jgi:hypothetical protein